jgi:glycosyltransferase involved in cell wall biosynthesis
MHTAKNPLFSVIIPTKNSEAAIEKCLKSIKKQTYHNLEVIVIDGFSTDKTRKIAENYGAITVLTKDRRSKARNIGSQKAKGDLFFFLDSDMELDPNVFSECIEKVREGYQAVIIPEVSVGKGFWAQCKKLEKSCYIGDENIEAARVFERKTFESVKGYDEELEAGEDWDLNQRVKKSSFSVGRIHALIKHQEGSLTLLGTVRKKYQYGKTLGTYQRKHPNMAKQQLRLIRPAFIVNWRKLANDPIHAIGMLVMKTCEFGAGWLGSISGET